MNKISIALVEQSVWRSESNARSMPLASGYLKSMILSDTHLSNMCNVQILNFSGTEGVSEIIHTLIKNGIPNIISFSVLGWNYTTFGQVSTTLKQLKSKCWIIWGGNHASDQAGRTARMWSAVDITVNGEGELTFYELIKHYVSGMSYNDLELINGISFKKEDGKLITTSPRARINDINIIPSPILSNVIDLHDSYGNFLYDYAILETNRGCPYSCAFCYWGGAIGQKVRSFNIDRLAAEIDYLAKNKVNDIMLCDANFGMLRSDEEFLELCIKSREMYGYPKHIMTSWAKNKNNVFYRMVKRMHETGFHSAFNLALQSTNDQVLEAMGRKNMKINDWENLSSWLKYEGLDVYGELIWGCPGETVTSFFKGYDTLARHVARIAVYPLLLMPNTEYSNNRDKFGFITCRTHTHDFELVLAHKTMSIEDNRYMHAFLFWARLIAEHLFFRNIWTPLFKLANITQSQILLYLNTWMETNNDPIAQELIKIRNTVIDNLEASSKYIETGLKVLYTKSNVKKLLYRWWITNIIHKLPKEYREFFIDLFKYDLETLPILKNKQNEYDIIVNNEDYYIIKNIYFRYDVEIICKSIIKGGGNNKIESCPISIDFIFKQGFCNDMRLYHNAHNLEYFGKIMDKRYTMEKIQ